MYVISVSTKNGALQSTRLPFRKHSKFKSSNENASHTPGRHYHGNSEYKMLFTGINVDYFKILERERF